MPIPTEVVCFKMRKTMKHLLIATVVVLSVLEFGNGTNVSFDKINLSAEMLKAAIENARDTIAQVNASVTNGIDAITTSGSNMVTNLTERMTNHTEKIIGEISELQQQFNESKYHTCFSFDSIEELLDNAINSMNKCVGSVLAKAQRVVVNINSSINPIMNIINGPTDFEAQCKDSYWGEWACVQKANIMAMVIISNAVKDMTLTATEAIDYLGTLQDALLTCANTEVRYKDGAAQILTNITSCIQSVNSETPQV